MSGKNQQEEGVSSELPDGLRRYLYTTAAVTGGCILIVEILGAKMLSPFFGTSHFVWTAQIAVTLLALAGGYYLGGWWVDRSPRLDNLYLAIIGAAVYLVATVPLVRGVSFACLKLNLALGSLLASLFLFLIPLALLAMTGPFLVRILTTSVKTVGGNVGRLTAISTLGSVTGTVLIGYVLIPRLSNPVTMLLTAGLLVGVSLIYFAVWGRGRIPSSAITAALLFLVVFGFAGMRPEWSDRLRFGGKDWVVRAKGNSNFGRMVVIDLNENGRLHRNYLNDNLVQNTYDPVRGRSLSLFTELLHGLPLAYHDKVETALCIGMGTGLVPMMLEKDGVEVDVVEINPGVVPLAEEWFDFEPERLRLLEIGDGRHFLNKSGQSYDAVMLDAFLGDSSPSHLMTVEAFEAVRSRMAKGGVLAMNTFGRGLKEYGEIEDARLVFDREEDYYTVSIYRTLKEVFPHVVVHGAGNGNVFFVASMEPLKARREPGFKYAHPDLAMDLKDEFVRSRVDWRFQVWPAWQRKWRVETKGAAGQELGMVMRDDFNPIDFHDAGHRESTRRGLVAGMQ
ncbi:MAG: spermidine synthase [Verrucomicrobiales bacterium]|nr:spermidine synthase [Verrucomicrobiales bacterium]